MLLSATAGRLAEAALVRSLADESSAGPSVAAISTPLIEPLHSLAINGNTEDKPQSKLWSHAGTWWGVLPDNSGTWVWRLDGFDWTRVLKLTTGSYHADVKPDGDVTHVLLLNGSSSKLASVEYVAGGAGSYKFWSQRPGLVSVALSRDAESATIDIDSTGRMWLVDDAVTTVEVRYSDAPYTSFSGPITIASGIDEDDIAVVKTMQGDQVGILWSNQTTRRYGFRLHQDGDSPTAWSADEVPAGSSALNVGHGMADDHLNVAVTSDGTLYAAVKTSYDTKGYTMIGLLVRRPGGTWDPLYRVDTDGTRPIVLVSEEMNRLMVAYRGSNTDGPIVYKESPLSPIDFTPRQLLIAGAKINDPTSTKQNFEGQVVIGASPGKTFESVRYTPGSLPNHAPAVDAGADAQAWIGQPTTLGGSAGDDGLPEPPTLGVWWTKVSGPGAVTFADASSPTTAATVDVPGRYVLRLTASDGDLSSHDEMTLTAGDPFQPVSTAFQDGVFPTPSYAGTRDAYLQFAKPTGNFGAATKLVVDGSPDFAALLKWDLAGVPAGSVVDSARLTLYVNDATIDTYEVYEALRDWNESEVTWNRSTTASNWQAAGAQGALDRGHSALGTVSSPSSGSKTFTLNAAGVAVVQHWLDDDDDNCGLIIQNYAAPGDSLGFISSESSSATRRPKLEVTYRPPGAPAPLLPAAMLQSLALEVPHSTSSIQAQVQTPKAPAAQPQPSQPAASGKRSATNLALASLLDVESRASQPEAISQTAGLRLARKVFFARLGRM